MKRDYIAGIMAAILGLTSTPSYAGIFEDVLAAAYTNNPRIKAERQRQEATDEALAQATSGFRPTITANYNTNEQKTSVSGSPDVSGNADAASLQLVQPLFRGGGTFSAWNAAEQRVRAGQLQLSSVEQQVLLNAVTAYMNVVEASALLDLSRNNYDVLAEQLKAADTRFQVGEVTRTDVAQSQARLSDSKSRLIAAEGQLLSNMATYERVIGARPEGTLTVPERLPQLPATVEEALERARAANPQLLASLHAASAAKYDVRSNEAVLLPRVNLVGSLSKQTGGGTAGNVDVDQNRIGVEVAIPLYQSGAEWSRVREASAVARQRGHESIDQRQSTDEATTQSWEDLQSAIATITARNDQIKAASLALDGVKQEQQYGSRTVLDVLDAEQELFIARTNLVQAQRNRIVAAYNLAFTLGQLTPNNLGLQVAAYNPQKNADAVEWQPLGY